MRAKGIVTYVAAAILAGTLAACQQQSPPRIGTAVARPDPAVQNRPSTALPFGRESMYALVNSGTMADADALLEDVWRVPRFDPVRLSGGPTWTEDPYRQMYWRFYFFALRPTSSLLWAYYRTGRTEYRDKLLDILRSYLRHDATNPPIRRDAMDDPHAIAFRGMILLNCFVKLRRSGDLPANMVRPMRRAIERIGAKLERPENFEGHYNHGYTQAAALLLISANLPDLDRSRAWGVLARTRLTGLLDRIVDVDGVENEKSPFYHFYVLDFMLETQRWADANRVPLPPRFRQRIDDMAGYAATIIWPDGHVPMLGSSVQLRADRSAALYRDLMRRFPEFAYAVTAGRSGTAPRRRAVLFRNSGQAVLRSPVDPAADPRDNTQILMDVGPMISAHSHEEALAIILYSAGRELLPESGLYTYSEQPARDYFFGTSAHNTITVDGRDQDGGPIRAGRTMTGPGWAYQSGAAAVYRGVLHRRSVLLLDRDLVLVTDELTSRRPHTYRQLWHLFPGARPVIRGTRTDVLDEYDNPALAIAQAVGHRPGIERYYGERKPMQGWYSAQYGRLQPNHVVAYVAKGTSARFYTLIGSGRYAGAPARVAAAAQGGHTAIDVCAGDYAARVAIVNPAGIGERVGVDRTGGCVDG
jgi:hypothetical protein